MKDGEHSGQVMVLTHEQSGAIKSKARRGATEVGLDVAGHDFASACGPSDLDGRGGRSSADQPYGDEPELLPRDATLPLRHLMLYADDSGQAHMANQDVAGDGPQTCA